MKNNKGITLIALVITIIVLLILAGVAIAMLSGENGILTRASDSKAANDVGAAKDEIALKAAEIVNEYYDEIYVSGKKADNTDAGAYNQADLNAKIIEETTKMTIPNVTVEAVKTGEAPNEKVTGIKVTSTTKTTVFTSGEFQANGGIKWTDNFKTK